MEKIVQLSEEQLRNAIRKTVEAALLEEGIDEVNWFQRAGQGLRNGFDNLKTNIGGAMAGAKAGLKYGGINAARQAQNTSNGQYKRAMEESVEKIDKIIAEELKKYIG